MKVLIADDEHHARQRVIRILSAHEPDLEILTAENGVEALEKAEASHPDVLILDIDMPGPTGIEVAFAAPSDCRVIFVTAMDDKAVEAFDIAAVDYVVKPFSEERLLKAWSRAREFAPEQRRVLKKLQDRLVVRIDRNYHFIPLIDISAILAQGDYIEIYAEQTKILVEMTLRSALDRLPDDFIQIHRSTVINLKYLQDIEISPQMTVVLKDHWQHQLAVGKTYQATLK